MPELKLLMERVCELQMWRYELDRYYNYLTETLDAFCDNYFGVTHESNIETVRIIPVYRYNKRELWERKAYELMHLRQEKEEKKNTEKSLTYLRRKMWDAITEFHNARDKAIRSGEI